ncbi:MAG: hypothetical protein ACSHX3_12305 [Litorimonas sp.]
MIRLSIILPAVVLLMAPCALAQTYETGSQRIGEPRSFAQFGDDDVGFTTLSPAQIADDVTTGFNPRTGAKEYLAPTFDPFEEDDALAGTVSLRSTEGARDLNGDPVVDGVLLDVSLFYTDVGDRHFGLTRDALFLNGDPIPIVLRDSRELECSARVTERVYRYDRYDDRYANRYIWMRPNYRGHRGFSYQGFGGRWNGYGTTRPRRRSRPRSHPRVNPRAMPRSHPRPRPQSHPVTPTPYYPHSDPRIDGEPQIRPRPRFDRPRSDRSRLDRRGKDLPTTTVTPNPRRIAPPPRTRRAEPTTPRPTPRPEPRIVTPQPVPTPRPAPPPRPRSTPKRREAPAVSSRNAPVKSRERSRVDHEMFPGDGYNDAIVVSSQRDCAREDQLTVFISHDRLDAARFDGLTLILRDVTYDPRSGQTTVYDERPLYIPPNYIEGFRLATSRP